MKALAMLLLTLGVVISSASGARHGPSYAAYREAKAAGVEVPLPTPSVRLNEWFSTGGPGCAVGLVLIVVGALIARRTATAEAESGGAAGSADFVAVLDRIGKEIDLLEGPLEGMKMDGDVPEVREALDRIATEVIGPLVDARGALIARHGLVGFAEYFGPFSAGERYLARCWSAITDGHAPEARDSLIRAREAFAQARSAWGKVQGFA